MALQYLEAFKALGQSPSTKYILPLEVTQLAESFRGFLEGSNEPGSPPVPATPTALPPESAGPDRPADAG
jgi:hypothetical protein